MNIIHAIRRALGLHPARRRGEPDAERDATSAAELVAMIHHDRIYNPGRRHSDPVDLRSRRRKVLTDTSTSG